MRNEIFHSSNLGYETYDSFYVGNIISVSQNDARERIAQSSFYVMILIIDGEGILVDGSERRVCRGDVIMLSPYKEAPLIKDAGYVAVKFRGGDSGKLASRFGFDAGIVTYHAVNELIPLFKSLIGLDEKIAALRAKGLVYYALSAVINVKDEENHPTLTVAERIKRYIDQNFGDPHLSLSSIGAALSYHKNYISRVFNERYGTSISKYTNILRVRHAKLLIEEGKHSTKEICTLVGFSDPEYFSNVFKTIYGETPKDFIKRLTSRDSGPF